MQKFEESKKKKLECSKEKKVTLRSLIFDIRKVEQTCIVNTSCTDGIESWTNDWEVRIDLNGKVESDIQLEFVK
jgi:hypothetical protein